MPRAGCCFASVCEVADDRIATRARRPSLRPVCVVPAINASRPHPPVRMPPPRFPVLPVMDAVLDIPGLSLRFLRALPPSPSREARCVHIPVLPHRHWPSGGSKTPGIRQLPRKSASRGSPVSALDPLAFVTAPLFARPRADRTRAAPCPLEPSQGLCFRAFRSPGHPMLLPDTTTAPT